MLDRESVVLGTNRIVYTYIVEQKIKKYVHLLCPMRTERKKKQRKEKKGSQ